METQAIFGIHFRVSSAGEEAISRVASGLKDVSTASQLTIRQAMIPLVQTTRQVARAFPTVTPEIGRISQALKLLSDPTRVSRRELIDLEAALRGAIREGGPFTSQLKELRREVIQVGKSFTKMSAPVASTQKRAGEFAAVLTDLVSEATGLEPKVLIQPWSKLGKALFDTFGMLTPISKTAHRNFMQILQTTGEFSQGLRGLTVPQVQQLIASVRVLGQELEIPGTAMGGLTKRLQTIAGELTTTQAKAQMFAAEALGPLNQAFHETIGTAERAPPAFQKLLASLTSLQYGQVTVEKLRNAMALASQAAQELALSGHQPLARSILEVRDGMSKLVVQMDRTAEAQRRQAGESMKGIHRSYEMGQALRVAQSAAHGLMLGTAALTGNLRSLLFSIVFLRFSMEKLAIAIAAVTIAIGGMIKVTQELIRRGIDVEDLMFKFTMLTGSVKEAGVAFLFAAEQAMRLGFPIGDLSSGLIELHRAGLLTVETFKAVADYARGTGQDFASAAKEYEQAIGKEKAALSGLKLGVKSFTKAQDELYTGMGRIAARAAANARILEVYGDAALKYAQTVRGAATRIVEGFKAVFDILGAPVVQDIIKPLLNAIAGLVTQVYTLVRAFVAWAQKSGLWESALAEWRKALQDLMPVLQDFWVFFRFVLLAALYAGIAAFRALGIVAQFVTKVIVGLWSRFRLWIQSIKPLWDALRRLAQALKDLNFRAIFTAAKEVFENLPTWLKATIFAAFAALTILLMSEALRLGAIIGEFILQGLRTWTGKANWAAVAGAILGALAVALAVGIFVAYLHPKFKEGSEAVITAITKDFEEGRFGDALQKLAMEIFRALALGMVTLTLGPEDRQNFTQSIVDNFNEAAEAIIAEDFSKAASSIWAAFSEALKLEFPRVGIAIIIGAALATVTASPAVGAMATLLALALLPKTETIKKWFTDNWPKAIASGLAGVVIGLAIGGPFGAIIGGIMSALIWAVLPSKERLMEIFLAWLREPFQYGLIGALETWITDPTTAEAFKRLGELMAEKLMSGIRKLQDLISEFLWTLVDTYLPSYVGALIRGYKWRGVPLMGGEEIPGAARGAIIARGPALVRVAERGPEIIAPLDRFLGGGTTVNVSVSGNYILDDRTASRLAQDVGNQIVRKVYHNYQVGFTGTKWAR